jgi:hypothetical protein
MVGEPLSTALNAPGSVMVTEVVAGHPVLDVTVTLYTPAARPLISSVVAVKTPGPVQLIAIGAVPPVIVRSIAPLVPPLQLTFVCVVPKVAVWQVCAVMVFELAEVLLALTARTL